MGLFRQGEPSPRSNPLDEVMLPVLVRNEDGSLGTAPEFPKYEPLDPESPCAACPAACCQAGTIYPLNQKERAFMEAGGNRLQEVDRSEVPSNFKVGRKRAVYKLLNTCVYLDPETRRCRVRKLSDRPFACGDFQAGGPDCNRLRKNHAASLLSGDLNLVAMAEANLGRDQSAAA